MADKIVQTDADGLCPVTVADRHLLAITGSNGAVRIWDPENGQHRATTRHGGTASSICPVTVAGRHLLASARNDGTVRIWDPENGEQHAALEGHLGKVNDVCEVTSSGRCLVASGGEDRTARIWDPETGTCLLTVPTHHPVIAVTWVAGSLVIALNEGILVIRPNFA